MHGSPQSTTASPAFTKKKKNKGISSRLEQLTLDTLLPGGAANYADLRGPTVKAANTRQPMPFLKDLADRHLTDPNKMDHVIIHQLLGHTVQLNRLIYSSGAFFTPEELAAFDQATKGIGKYMQLLRKRAKEAHQLLWEIVPKTHYLSLIHI